MTGATPFEDSDREKIYNRILNEEIAEASPSTSALTDLIHRLLQNKSKTSVGRKPEVRNQISSMVFKYKLAGAA